VTTDDMEIVSAVRAALAGKVGQDRLDLWFGANVRLQFAADTLTVQTPTPFMQNWLRGNFRKELEAACREVLGRTVAIEFQIDPSLGAIPAGTELRPATVETSSPPAIPLSLPTRLGNALPNAVSAAAPVAKPGRRFASLDSFVVGPCNRLAQASTLLAAERLGSVSPLYLHGPTGVGKTHLLEGLWTAAKKSRTAQALYLTAEQFTTYFLEALHKTGLPSFRAKYRKVDVLLIDDIHFFAGKKATLIELQATIDALVREGKQLVFAADRPPEDLKDFGSELTSRLSGGLVCRLDQPDQPTRLGILRRLAADRAWQVPDDVLEYIAAHLTSHARELAGALNRLHVASLAAGQPITLALAEETLGEVIRGGRSVALDDIAAAVCKTFGIEPTSLQSDHRAKRSSYPRMLAMWLARKHTRAALTEIGDYFGGRSHSTVISASKTVAGWMNSQSAVPLADRQWPIEDAIRRVEQNLRIG